MTDEKTERDEALAAIGTHDPRTFTAEDGEAIKELGTQAVKRPNPVYLLTLEEPFTVETDNGTMTGEPGDYLVYDEISGHVWPISADYYAAHYDEVTPDTTGDDAATLPRAEDNPDITVTPAED